MFNDVLRELRRMEQGERMPIELALDDEGYLDRVCPNAPCAVDFKVHFEDWCHKVPDEGVHCPICGFRAPSTEWNTPDQVEQIKAAALRHIHKTLGDAFDSDARRFNRSQRSDSFIKMSMSYRPGPLPILVPAEASDVMRQRSTCEACGCRYSSIGAAFFCPACGHNSAASTFDAAVETVRKTLDALPEIRRALTEAVDKDTAHDSARQICENGLVKLVSAFQRFAEAMYDAVPNENKLTPRRNVFQNLQESSELWRSAIGAGYREMLSESELCAMEVVLQQRHLLAHKDGIVDQTYLDRTGDDCYAVGQRLVVRADAVEALAVLVSKLAAELRRCMPDA
jgi:hypothetical protein